MSCWPFTAKDLVATTTINLGVVTTVSTSDVLATISSEDIGVVRVVLSSGVDSNLDPSEDAILQLVTKVRVVEDRVGGGSISLLGKDTVDLVVGLRDLVGVVRVGGLNLLDQVLVVEELTDVRGVAAGEGVVGEQGGVQVGDDVVVGGAAVVVTREEGQEGNHSVLVGALHTTQEGGVVVTDISSVSVTLGDQAGVDTCGVAAPDLGKHVGDGLAGFDIDELFQRLLVNVPVWMDLWGCPTYLLLDDDGDTLLTLQNIGAKTLTDNPVRTTLALGVESNAG